MEHLRTLRTTLAAVVLLRCSRTIRCDRRRFTSEARTKSLRDQRSAKFRHRVSSGPTFQEFIRGTPANETTAVFAGEEGSDDSYLPPDLDSGKGRKGSPG